MYCFFFQLWFPCLHHSKTLQQMFYCIHIYMFHIVVWIHFMISQLLVSCGVWKHHNFAHYFSFLVYIDMNSLIFEVVMVKQSHYSYSMLLVQILEIEYMVIDHMLWFLLMMMFLGNIIIYLEIAFGNFLYLWKQKIIYS